MSLGDLATSGARDDGPLSDRLSLGVAARLSRYLQVLTQARKMGKETISSQELSEYTHVNSTQIRRDLSGFGKFGKRGVGYNVDSLVSQIRKILRTTGKHNIAVGVLAVPTAAAQGLADQLVDAGVKIIFNYSEALLQVPPEVTVHTSSPAVDLLYALYFYLT
jgi:redox-sensing transcriptional repressor